MKAPINKYYATIFLGAAELVGALTCVFLVHVTGKRPLVFASLIGCGACFFLTATYANYLNLVPGSAVSNVVANASSFDKSMFINEQNFTDDGQTTEYIADFTTATAYEYGVESTTSMDYEYNDSIDTDWYGIETTTSEYYDYNTLADIGPTKGRSKRDTDENGSNDEASTADVHKIILPLPNADENQFLWLPLTLLLGSAYFAHIGIRLIPWMLIGEVYPVSVRSGASGMSSGIGYIFGFLSNKLFLGMVATLTLPGTFWFYSGVAFVGCIIFYFTLPETENKSLLEIENYFVNDPPSAVDNRSNGAELNRPVNGFDQITVLPPLYPLTNGSSQQTLRIGGDIESENEKSEDRRQSIGLDAISAVPEIIVSTPRAGSKRFMKSTNEM